MSLVMQRDFLPKTLPTLRSPANFPLGPLAVEFYDNGRKMVTTRNFRYIDPEYGIDIFIEEFFTTDLNSSPRLVWWFFSKWDYPEAGVVHDKIFDDPPQGWTRQNCDWVHWRLLRIGGMSAWKAELVYQALHLGSRGAWNEHRANDGALRQLP